MSMTMTVIVNVLLAVAVVGSLLLLLGYPGIHRDRQRRETLHRWHRSRGRLPRHVAD
jgi:hypothetical protein